MNVKINVYRDILRYIIEMNIYICFRRCINLTRSIETVYHRRYDIKEK